MDTEALNYFRLACIVILTAEILFGTVGNTISIMVWHNGRRCSKAACATYFKILAVTDICVLLIPALKFLLDLCSISLSHAHIILCKTFGFFELFGSQISAWLVVCVSVERVFSLCFPLTFDTKRAWKRACISTIIIIVAAAGLNSFELKNSKMYQIKPETHENGVIVNKTDTLCATPLTDVLMIVRSVSFLWFLGILPLILVTTCNCVIVVKIFMMQKMHDNLNIQSQNSAVTFTKICIAIGILYCLSILPFMLHTLNLFEIIEIIKLNTVTYTVFRMFAYNSLYLNSSLNFLLYCFTGKDFWLDIKEMFSCLKHRTRLSLSLSSMKSRTSLRSAHSSVYSVNQNSETNESRAVCLTSFHSRTVTGQESNDFPESRRS